MIQATVIIAKNNVHGKTLIFLRFAKQLPRGQSVIKIDIIFHWGQNKNWIFSTKIKRIKKKLLRPAELLLRNGTQEWIQVQICLSIRGEAHCGVFD